MDKPADTQKEIVDHLARVYEVILNWNNPQEQENNEQEKQSTTTEKL